VPPLPQRITSGSRSRTPGDARRASRGDRRRGGEVQATERTDEQRHVVFRDLTVDVRDEDHAEEVAAALHDLEGVGAAGHVDDVIAAHEGGKIRVENTREVDDAEDLALVYTPGVAKICRMIAEDPVAAYRLTIRRTRSRSSPTAPRCSGSATSGRSRPCP
jgi:malate dehydrogenase (oxaloacetate-decarboxylating)